MLVELEELGHALAFGHCLDGETVGCHHSPIVVLVGTAQFYWHTRDDNLSLREYDRSDWSARAPEQQQLAFEAPDLNNDLPF